MDVFFGFIKYEYINDILVKGIIKKDGKEIGYIDYKYDEDGNLLTEHWDFGGRWNKTFTYEYELPKESKPEYYTYSSPFLNPTKEFMIKEENYN